MLKCFVKKEVACADEVACLAIFVGFFSDNFHRGQNGLADVGIGSTAEWVFGVEIIAGVDSDNLDPAEMLSDGEDFVGSVRTSKLIGF